MDGASGSQVIQAVTRVASFAALGEERALTVLPVVFELEREFYESDARHTTADLAAMGTVAASQFRLAHPEISVEAVEALTWC